MRSWIYQSSNIDFMISLIRISEIRNVPRIRFRFFGLIPVYNIISINILFSISSLQILGRDALLKIQFIFNKLYPQMLEFSSLNLFLLNYQSSSYDEIK